MASTSMRVTFKRTHARGYSVTAERPGMDTVTMNPAPGYHNRLPHDAAHFIVENELGITGGVFGQLAMGGSANTFRTDDAGRQRKARQKSAALAKANKKDALFSEHAIYAAQARWENHEIIPDTAIPAADIERIIAGFEKFAAAWSKLDIGGSLTLDWNPSKLRKKK